MTLKGLSLSVKTHLPARELSVPAIFELNLKNDTNSGQLTELHPNCTPDHIVLFLLTRLRAWLTCDCAARRE